MVATICALALIIVGLWLRRQQHSKAVPGTNIVLPPVHDGWWNRYYEAESKQGWLDGPVWINERMLEEVANAATRAELKKQLEEGTRN